MAWRHNFSPTQAALRLAFGTIVKLSLVLLLQPCFFLIAANSSVSDPSWHSPRPGKAAKNSSTRATMAGGRSTSSSSSSSSSSSLGSGSGRKKSSSGSSSSSSSTQ